MEQSVKENYIKAGKISAEILEYGRSLIKKENSLLDVCNKIEEKIISLKAEPAFPAQISCNEIAAHFCPLKDDTIIFGEQLASLDIGVHVNGCIGDTALTVDLSNSYPDLVRASREALNEAIKIVQIGTTLGEIGKVIQETIESFNFKPVKNLSGHGLGSYNIHDKPAVPNYDNKDSTKLEKGMVIAIEPFATNGIGLIEEKGSPSIFSLLGKKPTRIGFVRNVQKDIEKLNGLPFTKRWLASNFSDAKVDYALKQFKQLGILGEYPPLVEKTNGFVSQAEHSLLIDDKVIVLTKKS